MNSMMINDVMSIHLSEDVNAPELRFPGNGGLRRGSGWLARLSRLFGLNRGV